MSTSTYSSLWDARMEPEDAPRIHANRRHVDPRFSVIGFTIDTGGRPYFEVLLATDRSLFHPEHAGRRHASNFYASREHSGLIRSDGRDSLYVVPTAVLRELARSPEIYYTAVAYGGADGSRPAMAHPHEALAGSGPSVSVSRDLYAAMSMEVLCTPLDKLCRIRHQGNGSNGYHVSSAAAADIDPAVDRAEGEDGYGLAAAQGMDAAYDEDPSYADARDSATAMDATVLDDGYDDGFDAPRQAGPGAGAALEGEYDESYDSAAPSRAPSMLEDEDYDDAGKTPVGRASSADDYDDGMGAAGLGEEEYEEQAGVSEDYDTPGYEGLDVPPPEPSASRSPAALPPPPPSPSGAAPARAPAAAPPPQRALDVPARIALIQRVAHFESGRAGYAAINADGEFEGRFPGHPAQGQYHIGLSYGIIQFTQDSKSLGRLLAMMRDRDGAKFREVFGSAADELVRVTNAEGSRSSESPGGRSARVQPVAGADIWRDPWLQRFRDAARADLFGPGARQIFNGAQNELASLMYLDPILPFARWLNLITDRALAMVLDRSVQMGEAGARHWIIDAAGPIKTAAYQQQAFAALNTDLASFQSATPGLRERGTFGPDTHAALTAALRASGRSPFPIPTRDQMLDAMKLRAESARWARRVAQLRSAADFSDAEFSI